MFVRNTVVSVIGIGWANERAYQNFMMTSALRSVCVQTHIAAAYVALTQHPECDATRNTARWQPMCLPAHIQPHHGRCTIATCLALQIPPFVTDLHAALGNRRARQTDVGFVSQLHLPEPSNP